MPLEVYLTTTQGASELLQTVLTQLRPYHWCVLDTTVACAVLWILLQWFRTSRQLFRTTPLRGPPGKNFFYGVSMHVLNAEDSGAVYEAWAQEYGPVYAIPSTLGSRRIVLCDPKAIAHFYSKETWTYIQTPSTKTALLLLFGKGLSWAHGEIHKRYNITHPGEKILITSRQRKSLTPAFSVAAIRHLTSIFYDSAYKAKGTWDVLIESSGEESAIIDVQKWMNHISLDTIGLAGFSHDFGALEGERAYVTEAFDAFGRSSRSRFSILDKGLLLLADVLPFLVQIPTSRTRYFQRLSGAMEQISGVLLARTQKELQMGVVGDNEERSIIGLLIKGANGDSDYHLTKDEVVAQMKQLLLAGYETTSISLTWALLELSRNPNVQTKLRNELIGYGADPTYDQFTNGLPYLDAVVHEILRLHPPVAEFTRIAVEDDVIPLSDPVCTSSGELVDSLTIAKDALITISMESINRSAAIWGKDAKVFQPARWLEDANGQDGIPVKAKEIQGHRHLLTFADGPRICLGKNFAVTEFKAVLTVLVKNYVFELRDGNDSKIEIWNSMLPRPTLAGEVGCKLPLRVRPYVA